MTTEDLRKEIATIEKEEVAVETNAGTYGAAEACRKCGCGSPEFATYTILERVGDAARRTVGGDPADGIGYARVMRDEINARRKHLSDLREQLRRLVR